MKINIMNHILFVILFSTIISGCSLFGGKNSVNDLTETFFVGEEGTQYFVKPLDFVSENGDEMYMDITFRYKDEIKDSAVINFTIETDLLIKKLDSVTISNELDSYTTNNIILLFAEKDEDEFKSRFSIKIPMSELDKLIKHQKWVFKLNHSNDIIKYYTNSNSESTLRILNDDLFVIFR